VASTRELAINIVGDGKSAARAFDDVGDAAERNEGRFTKVKTGITVASAAIVAGVVGFAADSVSAYSEAEQSQAALAQAYEKFPALANTSIDALRGLNTEIQRKTGFDDDQLASAQATLGQFGLTGDQVAKLTPLMADYAAKTGKDLATAAEDMGKAVMGQGRALKTVGVDFTDTGDAAGNFDQLIAGLDGTVGGFAATMGDTAAGKAQILQQSFGDIQETVGELLIPVLTTLADVGIAVSQWMADNPSIVQALAIALGVLTLGIIAANIAMWAMAANPIVLLIMAIVIAVGILIAGIWLLVANWDAVVAWVTAVWAGFVAWITAVVDGFVGWWNGVWSAVGAWITTVWSGFIGWITGIWSGFIGWITAVGQGFLAWWNGLWAGVGAWINSVWSGIVTGVTGFFNRMYMGLVSIGMGVIGWWNGLWSGISSFFGGIWDGILGTIRNVQTGFSTVFGAIGGIVRGAFEGVVGFVRGVINGIVDAVNGVIGAINGVAGAIGGAIGVNISIPKIPRLATGTITNGPMLALVGDNPGGREVIAPYDSYVSELQRAAATGARNASNSGPIRLHKDSVNDVARALAAEIAPQIMLGAKRTVLTAFGR
jgi:hypothetical protein